MLSAIPEDEQDYSSWKIDVALDDLEVPHELWDKKISELSGGWQRLALIMHANLEEPSVLLLDEPTNYLDLGKIFLLEKWLKQSVKTPYIVISHDRTFLDNCTTKTVHMRDGKLIVHNVPYTRAREALLNEDLAAAKARKIEEKEIARIRAAAKRIHIWSNGRNPDMERRSKAIAHTADQLEAKKTEVYVPPKREINFAQESVRPNTLLTLKNINVMTPDGRLLFKIPEIYINKGDRVALLGVNGSGKTSLIRQLLEGYKTPVSDHKIKKQKTGNIHFNFTCNNKKIPSFVHLFSKNEIEKIFKNMHLDIQKRLYINYNTGRLEKGQFSGQLFYVLSFKK